MIKFIHPKMYPSCMRYSASGQAKLAVLVIFVLSGVSSFGQDNLPADPTNKSFILPAPDARQFIQYGEYAVSRATGVPDISIPLYTISSGELSVPITLRYHASGIKVDEAASWVGLGFTLDGGGMVSRTCRGLPDEAGNGLLHLNYPFFDANGILDIDAIRALIDPNNEDYYSMNYFALTDMMSSLIDSEPDIFNYSIPGYSGSFYLNPKTKQYDEQQGFYTQCEGVTLPKSDLKIIAYISESTYSKPEISSLLIITPNGQKYYFGQPTTFTSGSYANVFGTGTWYLTKMLSSQETDSITFSYTNYSNESTNPQYQDTYYHIYKALETGDGVPIGTISPTPIADHGATQSSRYSSMKVLNQINFSSGSVVFNSTEDREDAYNRRLTSIDIFNKSEPLVPIKSFTFNNNDYFISSTHTAISSKLNKRLKLTSVQEKGRGNTSLPPYEFSYFEGGAYELPFLHSYAQDYWGYYNGANNNQSLAPAYNYDINSSTAVLGNANREPNAETMKAGTLHTIKYPTGGTTQFEFEANTVPTTKIVTGPSSYVSYRANSMGSLSTKTFTPTKNVSITINYSITFTYGESQPTLDNSLAYVRMSGGGIDIQMEAQYAQKSKQVTLTAGTTYLLTAYSYFSNVVADIHTSSWSIPGPSTTVNENKIVGGLRVRSIKNYDETGILLKQKYFDYSKPSDPTISSGSYNAPKLPDPADFSIGRSLMRLSGSKCHAVTDFIVSITSQPQTSVGFPLGNPVTYAYVTERDEENNTTLRKGVFTFSTGSKDHILAGIPASLSNKSFLRGQPIREQYYNTSNQIIRQINYAYEEVTFPQYEIIGLKLGYYWDLASNASGCFHFIVHPFPMKGCSEGCTSFTEQYQVRRDRLFLDDYSEPIQWKRLVRKIETLDGVTDTTHYFYDPQLRHTNVVKIEQRDSRNRLTSTEIQYAAEENENILLNKNMTGIPLKSKVSLNGILTGGLRITYGQINGLYIPHRFEELLADGSYHLRKEVIAVNPAGRITEYKASDGSQKTMIWGYHNQYPIAEIVNAAANEVFHTSFEENGTLDSLSKTGTHVKTTDVNVPLHNLTNGSYILSYWKRDNGQWNLYESTVSVTNNTYSLSITGVSPASPVDEIRFFPTRAFMSTYTYQPLVNVTSIMDPNGISTQFAFDPLGRLAHVTDNDLNIIKKHEYNYKATRPLN